MLARTRAGVATPGAGLLGGSDGGAGTGIYSYLSMYAEVPDHEITLEDFEVSAFDRLRGAPARGDPPGDAHCAHPQVQLPRCPPAHRRR
jgi:hypothetical protein